MGNRFNKAASERHNKGYQRSSESQGNFRQETDKTEEGKRLIMEELLELMKQHMQEKYATRDELNILKEDQANFEEVSVNFSEMIIGKIECYDNQENCAS